LFFTACEKDSKECVKVKYVSSYCPKTGAVLVDLLSSSEAGERTAILNIPEAFQIRDKVFYVTYHYDESLDKLDPHVLCPAIFSPQKIFVSDSASENECKN